MQLDPRLIRQQIEQLKLAYPDLVEDDEAWALSLESETDLPALMTSIIRRIEDARALAVGTVERLDELKARRDRFIRRIDGLRSLAFKVMEAANLGRLELAEATLSIRKGQPKLVVTDENAPLPDELCIVRREPDKTAIKERIQSGATVPGYVLDNGDPSLTIRIR